MEEQNSVKTNAQILDVINEAFKPHQNFYYAILGGLGISLLCAFLWATISVITEYQIGFVAIVIGLIVGLSVRYFGAGQSINYGILGGTLALFSCVIGNLFANIGFIANYQGMGYIETFKLLDFTMIKELMIESFSPMDLFFYAIAIYEGFTFSFRHPTDNDLEDYYKNRFTGTPVLNNLRGPFAIGSFFILAVIWFLLSGKVSGEQEFLFDDGTVSARGNYIEGEQDGAWDYFHKNGQKQASGTFTNGLEEGKWEYFDTTGQLIKTIEYKDGMSHGLFLTFENGSVIDSGHYINNREEGKWVSRYPNGQMMLEGVMKRGQNEDLWKYYYENGQVSNEGHYRNSLNEGSWKAWNEDGKLIEEIIYKEGEIEEIIFAHENGKDLVVNGNGNYQYTDEEGNITSSGRVENGKNIGIWKSFYPDGSIQNEMMFEDNESKILNVFDRDGGQQVKNGNGMMRITYESGNLEEEGEVKNGKRYGTWFEYYDIPDAVSLNSNYENGMLNGMMTSYNLDQTIWIEGKLKNNIREGLWKWYFRTGGLESEVNFIAGEKDGIQKFYNESGIEVKQEIYKNGEFLEEKIINLK